MLSNGAQGAATILIPRPSQAIRALMARRSEARQALRVALGTLAAFAVYHLFNLPQGYWAVFTVVIVMQASIGATLSASLDRLIGTVAGALVGGFAAAVRPETPLGLAAALGISVALTSFLATQETRLKVAPITAVIMLVSPSAGQSPIHAALLRVIEIALGSIIAVLATLVIFPARSQRLVTERVQQTLTLLSELLDAYAGRVLSPRVEVDLHGQHDKIRAALAQVETAMKDAARERSSRLAEHRISEAVPRTLWRVRNDAVTVGRALAEPLPEVVAETLAPSSAALLRAEAAFMRTCGHAILNETRVRRGALDHAITAFETAVQDLRREQLTNGLTFEAVGRVFGLVFALQSLFRNLSDLADRIDEGGRDSADPPEESSAA